MRRLPLLAVFALFNGSCSEPIQGDQENEISSSAISVASDQFGVTEIYPTEMGGREWYLGNALATNDPEWRPDTLGIIKKTTNPAVFHTNGDDSGAASVRFHIHSPTGKKWWHNVEMTMYVRMTSSLTRCADSQVPHWEMAARGERHWYSTNVMAWTNINDGVIAPAGTKTWPWYQDNAVKTGGVNWHCLGSTYHGNLYTSNGRVLFEKEISHTDGYTGPKGSVTPRSWKSPKGLWIGYKFIARDSLSNPNLVHLEVWGDMTASNTWTRLSSFDDLPGKWAAGSSTLDGCAQAPYSQTTSGTLNWAGPWALFRSDCIGMDFKWLSVREVGPIP